jgi:RHS repeat-associated protein
MDGVEHRIDYTYDDASRLKQTHYPQGFGGDPIVTENSYDASGILTAVERLTGAARDPLWHIDQAFEGHLIQQETFGNDAVSTYAYHPQRRWLQNLSTTLEGDEVQQIDYTHYDNGLVHQRTEGDSSPRTYNYDSLNRLSSVIDVLPSGSTTVSPFGYDFVGNMVQNTLSGLGTVSINYHFNGTSQPGHLVDTVVTPNGTNTYQYDDNGNVEERIGPDIPGGQQTIDYTPFDLPSVITTGSATTTLEYSPFEERTIQRGPDSTRYYITDLYQRVAGTAPEDTIEQRFQIYAGSRLIGEIIRVGASEETLYFHTDHLGSPHTITSSTGNVTQQAFDAFGAPVDNPDPSTRFGFTGHQHDDALGLIDMRGRIYDTLAGRFATPDPIMQAPYWSQGLNRYAYVFNDPINMVDPSGFAGLDIEVYFHGVEELAGGPAPAPSGLGTPAGAAAGGMSPVGALGAIGSIANAAQNIHGILELGSEGGSGDAPFATPGAANETRIGSNVTGAPQQATKVPGPPGGGQPVDDVGPTGADAVSDESLAASGARRPRGAPLPGRGGPVLRGPSGIVRANASVLGHRIVRTPRSPTLTSGRFT